MGSVLECPCLRDQITSVRHRMIKLLTPGASKPYHLVMRRSSSFSSYVRPAIAREEDV